MFKFMVVSPMLNGEQNIECFDTLHEATNYATEGDGIYVLIEELAR